MSRNRNTSNWSIHYSRRRDIPRPETGEFKTMKNEKAKLKLIIPKGQESQIEEIKKSFAMQLADPFELVKAINREFDHEKPWNEAEEIIERMMFEALTDPIREIKKKVFELAGVSEFLAKHPDDPKYQDFYKSLSEQVLNEENYRQVFKSRYNIILGDGFTYDIAEKMNEVFEKLPKVFFKNELRIDTKDMEGRYARYLDDHHLEISPYIFKEDFWITPERKVNFGQKVIVHEMGHGLDHLYKFSKSPEWRKISGWSKEPGPNKIRCQYNQAGRWKFGKWYHNKDANFISDYARRNPREDFAESFAYYALGS